MTRQGSRSKPTLRAIEQVDFPFEHLSAIAELESWRKEVNRPIYHMHKWWAQRLGSVFRALVIGATRPAGTDVLREFYALPPVSDSVVFDPFMGSGTTIGEAAKLGVRAIGRDINPVSHFACRIALSPHDRKAVLDEFASIERDTASQIRQYYQTDTAVGLADVLYYFWVKHVSCPICSEEVDLFSRYVFSQNAYPKKRPEAKALCPHCGAINTITYDAPVATCSECHLDYLPQEGPASNQRAQCKCGHEFPIARTVAASGAPPRHRMYAKMVLLPSGDKVYMRATDSDRELYKAAEEELATRSDPYPIVRIIPGYNTNQALNYNYDHWHLMFNARQLLCLSTLAARIARISNREVRDLFACLFSGCLEFNNMFASFKGEGTGAVRHMFSHHILKPERTPLEANLWGTPKVLNTYLKANGGYSNGPNLVWAKVCQIWPGHISFIGRYWTGASVSASQLRAYLDSGQYAIMAERTVGNLKHWVVLTGHGSAASNTFYCNDPAYSVSALNYGAFTGYGIYKFSP